MPKTRPPYPPEFRRQMVELVRAGRTPEELGAEFEPTAQSIRNWVAQADRDEGKRMDGLTTQEREELVRLRRENRRLLGHAGATMRSGRSCQKSRGLVRSGGRLEELFGFVSANQAHYHVTALCRVLAVSPSGYYAWRNRGPSAHKLADEKLTRHIRDCHSRSRGTYGAPRVHADLHDEGIHVSRKRVARLMRQAGLAGVSRRQGPRTTIRAPQHQPAADLVGRVFTASEPDCLWVADITYVPTATGFLFLAVVVDAFSRRVVGWSMATNLHTHLVLDALSMALCQRRPHSVIHHSDHGCQYTSVAFGKQCREAGVRPAMGSVGDCYDNAMCESFFATLECELLDRSRFRSQTEARIAVFDFIEGWYNRHRRHSAIGYLSPAECERRHYSQSVAESTHLSTKVG